MKNPKRGLKGHIIASSALLLSLLASYGKTAVATEFGILSETIPGVIIRGAGINAVYGEYGDAGNPCVNLIDYTGFREGSYSVSNKVQMPNGNHSQGWFVQWGAAPSINMSAYASGTIRFWFKAPPELLGRVDVGIRSSNVNPGDETSKVTLNFTYAKDGSPAIFDNNWHPIAIPIAPMVGNTGGRAKLDQMAVLINFAVIGNNVNGHTFYVDNVRWDTVNPGVLSAIQVSPNAVVVSTNTTKLFTARGVDAGGNTVDIWPTWTATGGTTPAGMAGVTIPFKAGTTPGSASVTAFAGLFNGTANFTIASQPFMQSVNIFSDLGLAGPIGASWGAAGSGTTITLDEISGVAPEGTFFRRATYTLDNSDSCKKDAFAVQFINEGAILPKNMLPYSGDVGYLTFVVKTPQDLEISIRSDNVDPNNNRAKILLSELGVPTDNTFRRVTVALQEFKDREPNLDFGQIRTYFAIGAISNRIGEVTNQVFDIDDVHWRTRSGFVVSQTAVYMGLRNKQNPSTGLLISYNDDAAKRAVTYDNALAALVFTRYGEPSRAQSVFNFYLAKYTANPANFTGFYDEYNVENGNVIGTINGARSAGPNAWLLLALIYYKRETNSTAYDALMQAMADYLTRTSPANLATRAPDGGIRFGYDNTSASVLLQKSTEHNLDCYAALKAYSQFPGKASYGTIADGILNWLNTTAWDSGLGRFNVGQTSSGVADKNRALDLHSWPPLSIPGYSSVVVQAEPDFGVTKVNARTGAAITGFDFSGSPVAPPGPPASADKDAVWLEGTAQMVLAYSAVGDPTRAQFYLSELHKAVFEISPGVQGLTYATNFGTGYGFMMNFNDAAISSMAWYLFATAGFNPFLTIPANTVIMDVRNISDNVHASSVTWTVNVPAGWVRANQYIYLELEPLGSNWGVQIYTDNKSLNAVPRFVDPTPGVTFNRDSNPAGLLLKTPGVAISSAAYPMAWRIVSSTTPTPAAIRPYDLYNGAAGPEAFNWFYMSDAGTPAIDFNGDNILSAPPVDGEAFIPGNDYATVRKNGQNHFIQADPQTLDGYVTTASRNYIFLAADFGSVPAQVDLQTTMLTIELFNY